MKTIKQSARCRALHCCRKGGTLVSVIVVMLMMGVMGVSVVSLTSSSEHSYLSANAGSRAYYLAESGLRYAQQVFSTDGWRHGRQRTLILQGGDQIDIIRIGNQFWATAIVDAGTAKEARARIPMALGSDGGGGGGVNPPTPVLIDEFAVFGDVGIALGKNTLIEGDVAITNEDIAIRGDVEGSVLARNVVLSGLGSVDAGTITGGIYSSGTVDVISGTVNGDIQSANGISIQSAKSTVKGWLFSNGAVTLGGGAIVLGHIHSCGADVTIGGNGTVIGTAEDPIEIRTDGNVYLSGSAEIYGTVYAGGTIEMTGSAQIIGGAYAGGVIDIGSNNTITEEALQFSPTYLEQPICPYLANLDGLVLPDPAEFTTGGTEVNVPQRAEAAQVTYKLIPGSYGGLTSANNSQKKYADLQLNAGLSGHGYYYFDSILFGANTTLFLNLAGTHDIRIFVGGDVTLGTSLNVMVSSDGINYLPITDPLVDPYLAARVYLEAKGDFSLGAGSNWFGTVYTPTGNLKVGNSCELFGSYYSGGGHDIIASTVFHVVPNYFSEQ